MRRVLIQHRLPSSDTIRDTSLASIHVVYGATRSNIWIQVDGRRGLMWCKHRQSSRFGRICRVLLLSWRKYIRNKCPHEKCHQHKEIPWHAQDQELGEWNGGECFVGVIGDGNKHFE